MLNSKKILLFVSGSIATFKSLLLIRALKKEGAEVKVIATSSALRFVGILSFECLSGNPVLCDDNESWVAHGANHISYAKWADVAIFAPISVNSLNKLANGIADNVYLSSAIALRHIPKLLALSANTYMLSNPTTRRNIESLKQDGYSIIDAIDGNLACGDNGNGAMASVEEIVFNIKRELYKKAYWQDKYIVVTGGGSSENIDSIRCISNHSSGLQASYLALGLFYLGANVCFITSKLPLIMPSDIAIYKVNSSKEYLDSITKQTEHKQIDMLFMVAAISDYIPTKQIGKLKKSLIGPNMTLGLHENTDILRFLSSNYTSRINKKIAFKAECDSTYAYDNAKAVLESKGCDLVCLNIIDDDNKAFAQKDNILHIISSNNNITLSGDKFSISMDLCRYIEDTDNNKH